jgi:hypothetical protein
MCGFLEETRDLDCLPRETAATNKMAPGGRELAVVENLYICGVSTETETQGLYVLSPYQYVPGE